MQFSSTFFYHVSLITGTMTPIEAWVKYLQIENQMPNTPFCDLLVVLITRNKVSKHFP